MTYPFRPPTPRLMVVISRHSSIGPTGTRCRWSASPVQGVFPGSPVGRCARRSGGTLLHCISKQGKRRQLKLQMYQSTQPCGCPVLSPFGEHCRLLIRSHSSFSPNGASAATTVPEPPRTRHIAIASPHLRSRADAGTARRSNDNGGFRIVSRDARGGGQIDLTGRRKWMIDAL